MAITSTCDVMPGERALEAVLAWTSPPGGHRTIREAVLTKRIIRRVKPSFHLLACLFCIAAVPAPAQTCDSTLWKHVYHGSKFATAKDRLNVIKPCITVTGKIESASPEADGDYHIRIRVDSQFKNLLNGKNNTGQKGFLVIEPMCSNPVTQPDTLAEKVCDGFKQRLFKASMRSKRVSITGVYVQDMEHGWREIHPVTSLAVVP